MVRKGPVVAVGRSLRVAAGCILVELGRSLQVGYMNRRASGLVAAGDLVVGRVVARNSSLGSGSMGLESVRAGRRGCCCCSRRAVEVGGGCLGLGLPMGSPGTGCSTS